MSELRRQLAVWLWDNVLKSDADRCDGNNFDYADRVIDLLWKRWIPVEERLPREGQTVLCLQENGKYKLCLRAKGKWEEDSGFYLGHITHWMSLPPAPGGGE